MITMIMMDKNYAGNGEAFSCASTVPIFLSFNDKYNKRGIEI